MTHSDGLSISMIFTLLLIGALIGATMFKHAGRRKISELERDGWHALAWVSIDDEDEMLAMRWAMAERDFKDNVDCWFPSGFRRPATPKDLASAREAGAVIQFSNPTAGQVSDLMSIALMEKPLPEDAAILDFFEINHDNYSRVRANHEAMLLQMNEKTGHLLDERPIPKKLQMMLDYFDVTADGWRDAQATIAMQYGKIEASGDDEALRNAEAYESIVNEVLTETFLEENGLREPSTAQWKATMGSVTKAGNYETIAENLPIVTEFLRGRFPELRR